MRLPELPVNHRIACFTVSDAPSGRLTFITIHPSSIYRHPEKEEQEEEYRRFASDIKLVQRKLAALKAA